MEPTWGNKIKLHLTAFKRFENPEDATLQNKKKKLGKPSKQHSDKLGKSERALDTHGRNLGAVTFLRERR